jgi:hypothetical protein
MVLLNQIMPRAVNENPAPREKRLHDRFCHYNALHKLTDYFPARSILRGRRFRHASSTGSKPQTIFVFTAWPTSIA